MTEAARAAAPAEPRARRKHRRWRAALQIGVALALLAIVARIVPWRDELTWTQAERAVTVSGTIHGDWKAEAIEFEVERGGEPLPAPFDELARGPGRLAVRRALEEPAGAEPSAEPRWSWRPGMPRVFRELDPRGLLLAFAAFSVGQLSGITRWWRLLALAGVRTKWWNAFRLSFLGLFFNLVVPGGVTGGDVVKSVIVARENPARRAGAFMSVYVDRIIGLFVLALLAAVVILAQGNLFAALRVPVLVFLAGGVLAALVYANRSLRRWIRFDEWVDKLPLGGAVRKLDEALLLYSRHPVELAIAVVFSLVNHVAVILGCLALGRAFGDAMPAGHYFAAVPIANAISALPLSPGGWGFGEAAFGTLFGLVGGSSTIGVATSVTFRLCMMVYGLAGGLFLLMPSAGLSWRELEEIEA